MDAENVHDLKKWFDAYVRSFDSNDPVFKRNIDLKFQHTQRVCREAVDIGRELGLDESDCLLAEVTALFHDVGRFEQYQQYKTFSDKKSINHAAFGVDILRRHAVLSSLDVPLQNLILKVISYHNQATLPEGENPRCLFFSRLLRDADKLDIWRVVTDYYEQKAAGETNETIEMDLPDTFGISELIYENLMRGEVIRFDSMRNLNDFKLFQVGWVYDVNFPATLKRLKERGYLAMLQAALPETDDIRRIFKAVFSYMDKRLNNES